jgi:hypothetical protein
MQHWFYFFFKHIYNIGLYKIYYIIYYIFLYFIIFEIKIELKLYIKTILIISLLNQCQNKILHIDMILFECARQF